MTSLQWGMIVGFPSGIIIVGLLAMKSIAEEVRHEGRHRKDDWR